MSQLTFWEISDTFQFQHGAIKATVKMVFFLPLNKFQFQHGAIKARTGRAGWIQRQ